ncbi:MAG: hypothetical protein KDC13_07260 [Bacteroidetes bacterium]|nr:hypothetical protein [Bacteroidota bacterium]
MKQIQPKVIFIVSVIAIAAVFRLIPHWPNFTPVAAIAIMGGAFIANRALAFAIPLIAMVVSDVLTIQLINFKYITVPEYFASSGTLFIYLSVLVMTALGMLIYSRRSFASVAGVSALAAVAFFLISNFGAWLNNTLPKTAAGLMATYELGIPFFANNLAGNLFFGLLFFAVLTYVPKTVAVFQENTIK